MTFVEMQRGKGGKRRRKKEKKEGGKRKRKMGNRIGRAKVWSKEKEGNNCSWDNNTGNKFEIIFHYFILFIWNLFYKNKLKSVEY